MQLTSRESLLPRAATNTRRSTQSGNRLGERVRQLRVAAGLTQTDLAGTRFSKEYVSQIERGKTRPTRETIEWLAQQLADVKTAVLVTGSPELEVRLLSVEAWARQDVGEVRDAIELLARARSLTEGQGFSYVDRADVLFRLGVCRYKLSSIATAVALFDE